MYKYRVFLRGLAIIVLLLIPVLTRSTAIAAITSNWFTCDTCPEPPEVSISGDTIVLGIADRPEDSEQNRSIHGASALLPPATKYTISFDYILFTWDSYNPTTAGWTGYWDSFSVSVTDRPYWELPLTDPVTPNNLPGLGFIWGGTLWADGVLEHVSGTKTITVQGNPSGTNYLNVILDTLTEPHSNHRFPSWGTVTITEVRTDVETTLPSQAANLAKAVVGAEYLWGGKGWDFESKVLIDPQQVFQGYNYWNPKAKRVAYGQGLDCSGLILWSYNKVFGATSMLGGPIKYEGADGQYRYNSLSVSENDLTPGDLLFFDWDQDGRMDHMAMYVGDSGGNDVVHASRPGVGIVWANKDALKQLSGFVDFRRVRDAQVGLIIKTHSSINLIVTDPGGVTINTNSLVETDEEGLVEVPGALYYSVDNDLDDLVIAPFLKVGTYTIEVEPKAGVAPTDTYSLEVEGASKHVILAQGVPISGVPEVGYTIISTGDEIVPGPPPTVSEVTLRKSVSPNTVTAGVTVEYTITMENTGNADAIGVIITDTLPSGFTYQTGSTGGATTDDPTINGQQLTWPVLFTAPAGDTLTLSFKATASSTPGTFFNNVEASGINLPPVQTGDTAPVTIQAPPVEPCSITGKVSLQGRSNHGDATIRIDGTSFATTASDGRFTVEDLDTGAHIVTASHLGYLSSKDNSVPCPAGQTTQMPETTLLGGDTNNDKDINLFDLAKVGAAYSSCTGDGWFRPEADINETGCVDILDLVLVGTNYGRTGPTGWPTQLTNASAPPAFTGETNYQPDLERPFLRKLADVEWWNLEVNDVSNLYGIDVTIAFDPALVKIVDADPDRAGVQIMPGPLFAERKYFIAKNLVAVDEKGGVGTIRFAATLLNPSEPIDGDGVVATISVRLIGKPALTTPANFSVKDALLADKDGHPLLIKREGSTIRHPSSSRPRLSVVAQ